MHLKKQSLTLFTVLLLCGLLYIRCHDSSKSKYVISAIATHSNGQQFVGSATCIDCHKEIYDTHQKTAHYNTSATANALTVKGATSSPNNTLNVNDSLYVKIEQRNGSFYQNAYAKKTDALLNSNKIDLVIGSGVKGQSFLNWRADSLHQIHASYFVKSNSWIKSPGYKDGVLQNNRRISSRCLECHTTFVETRPLTTLKSKNTYNRNRFIEGVDCERCHGPSAEHVKYHNEHPKELQGKHIKIIKALTRQQQLDVCALCHSGPRKLKIKPEFSFLVGDRLNTFSSPDFFSSRSELDVHGNQYGMLLASKCFKNSKSMTCTTCHNVHKNERNHTQEFVNKCLSCHDTKLNCGLDMALRVESKKNCISCHMPEIKSKSMFKANAITKDTISVKVFSHYIGVYPNAIK